MKWNTKFIKSDDLDLIIKKLNIQTKFFDSETIKKTALIYLSYTHYNVRDKFRKWLKENNLI